MKTNIIFYFPIAVLSNDLMSSILAAVGITDVAISDISINGCVLTIAANRFLTSDEKTRVVAALMANLIRIEDSE